MSTNRAAGGTGSPALDAGAEAAFELKFVVKPAMAQAIESRAARDLKRDPHGESSADGAYDVLTLSLDTPAMDVCHRSGDFGEVKHRIRRYGNEDAVYLERKSRTGDRVGKRRTRVLGAEAAWLTGTGAPADWPGEWFRSALERHDLRPVATISYRRTAFVAVDGAATLRLTLDRNVRAWARSQWGLDLPAGPGSPVAPDHVVCEVKFSAALPGLFRELVRDLQLSAIRFSKYRRSCAALGLDALGRSPDESR